MGTIAMASVAVPSALMGGEPNAIECLERRRIPSCVARAFTHGDTLDRAVSPDPHMNHHAALFSQATRRDRIHRGRPHQILRRIERHLVNSEERLCACGERHEEKQASQDVSHDDFWVRDGGDVHCPFDRMLMDRAIAAPKCGSGDPVMSFHDVGWVGDDRQASVREK
jgi:hypothetical protein